jgi:hypothetical protein
MKNSEPIACPMCRLIPLRAALAEMGAALGRQALAEAVERHKSSPYKGLRRALADVARELTPRAL